MVDMPYNLFSMDYQIRMVDICNMHLCAAFVGHVKPGWVAAKWFGLSAAQILGSPCTAHNLELAHFRSARTSHTTFA